MLRERQARWVWTDDHRAVTLPGADLADLIDALQAERAYGDALVVGGRWR